MKAYHPAMRRGAKTVVRIGDYYAILFAERPGWSFVVEDAAGKMLWSGWSAGTAKDALAEAEELIRTTAYQLP